MGKSELDYREHRVLCSDVELECMGEVRYYSTGPYLMRHRFLDPIGSRSVSLDQGLEMQMNGVNRVPQGGTPIVIPAYHKV